MKLEEVAGLVTGGASGLGEGTARMIVGAGGSVAILDLSTSKGVDLAAELGDRAHFVPADVTVEGEVAAAIDEARERLGRLNLLVNCAGVSPAARVLSRDKSMHSLELFRRTVEINLIGAFDVIRNCARVMADNEPGPDGERGVIVNTTSISAFEGQVGQAAYAASKAGIAGLGLQLARDLSVWGIRVMTIAPGIMDTPMLAGVDDARRNALIDLNVFPARLGNAADYARLVAFLVESTMMNGEIVRLDAALRLGPK